MTELEQKELKSYKLLVENQVFYNRREEYLSLVRNYLDKKITLGSFIADFLEMESHDARTAENMRNDFEQLSNFSIDSELLTFEEPPFFFLIDRLYNLSMLIDEFGTDDEENGISEADFKSRVEEAFSNPELFK
jgi:hypothetical protein